MGLHRLPWDKNFLSFFIIAACTSWHSYAYIANVPYFLVTHEKGIVWAIHYTYMSVHYLLHAYISNENQSPTFSLNANFHPLSLLTLDSCMSSARELNLIYDSKSTVNKDVNRASAVTIHTNTCNITSPFFAPCCTITHHRQSTPEMYHHTKKKF